MVYVNNLFAATNSTQSINKIFEKSDENNDFFSILSKSMNGTPTLQNQSTREALQSVDRDVGNVHQGYKTQRSIEEAGTESEVAVGTAQKTETEGIAVQLEEEVHLSDEQEQQIESILLVIDEIMSMLQKIVIDESNEPLQSNESSMQTFKKLEAGINESMGTLLELADNAPGEVSEMARELAQKLEQMLTTYSAKLMIEDNIKADIDPLKDLIGKMINETANVKDMISAKTTTEGNVPKNTDTESTIVSEGEILNPNSIQAKTSEAIGHSDFDSNENLQDNTRKDRSSIDDTVNIRSGPKSEDIIGLEDYSDTSKNIVEDPQESRNVFSSIPKVPIPTKTGILHQVVENTKVFIGSDKSEMVIQLKPESLGKIKLNVIHERGEIVAEFTAENEQVKSILESNMQLLKDSLEESGIDIQSLSVSVGQHGDTDDDNADSYTQKGMQRHFFDDNTKVSDVNHTYRYSGLTGNLHDFQESEINLIA